MAMGCLELKVFACLVEGPGEPLSLGLAVNLLYRHSKPLAPVGNNIS